jgi:hypothetical protein
MNQKMKSRRPVALRSAPRRPTTISLADRRRDCFQRILERIQDLPGQDRLPQDIQDELKKYSRSQNSEKILVRLTDYPVFAVKQILSALLQDLDGNLSVLVGKMLREIRLTHETMKYMSEENQLKIKLNQYVEKNLSNYMLTTTTGSAGTDVSMEQLQKDLAGFFPVEEGQVVGNVFEPLFHSFLPEETIKRFLANMDATTPIQHQVSKFLAAHKFDLIQELFDNGFQPTSPQDWKDALPDGYYQQFPPALWKLKQWDQFKPFVELSKRYSLNIHDFIKYSFYKDHERLIRIGHQILEEKRIIPIRPSKHAPFFPIFDENQSIMLQRTRPWIDGLICVLLQPKTNCELYLSKPYGKKYFFTTDALYKDLANPQYQCRQQKNSRVFSIEYEGFRSEFYVYHLLRDGRIAPQTYQDYERGVLYMSMDRPQVSIPKIEEYFLSLPFDGLSEVDQDFFRGVMIPDISFYLSTLYDDKMDFDAMATDIVSGMMAKTSDKPLKTFLEHAFHLYFLFNPRYNLSLLTNVVKERMNLFFYNLENLDELPIEFYYPQFHFLGTEKQQSFQRWHDRCRNNFVMEKLYYLFTKNYPVLRVRVPESRISSSPPKQILLNIETGESLCLLHPYHNQYIRLPEVAESITQDQEYLVGNEALTPDFVSLMERYYDMERVRMGMGSYLMDNDYEILISAAETQPYDATSPTTIIGEEKEAGLEELPHFKEKAYQFLELLSAV